MLGKKIIRHCLTSFDIFLSFVAAITKTKPFSKKVGDNWVLLKNLGGIGDYLMLTASFEGYRTLFPNSKIALLVRSAVQEIAERNQNFDLVIGIDFDRCRTNVLHRVKLWRALLKHNFEVYVNLDYSTNYESLDSAILRWSLARRRIAHHCLDPDAVRDYRNYSTIIEHQSEWLFEIERNNEMLRQLGLSSYQNSHTSISNIGSFKYSKAVAPLLPRSPYLVVAPGSLLKDKCWPPAKYASIIDRIGPHGFETAICGTADDREAASEIIRLCRNTRISDLTGRSTLVDLCLLIRHSEFVICNDSSAAHIAQAMERPAFVILGGGHYGRFLPYPGTNFIHHVSMEGMDCFYCHWKCRYDYFKCVADVEVDAVYRKILESLSPVING
jgi:ADP-heptose:LPS heptosyltransferase